MDSFGDGAWNLKRELERSGTILESVLSSQRVEEVCTAVGHTWRRGFWQPTVVLLTFLRQVLLPNCSCRQTVAFTIAERGPRGRRVPRSDPSAYSQARQRLPLAVCERLGRRLADELSMPDRRWRGHRVRVVDGSSVSMPDTAELQAVFPQPETQAPGCGFPVARLLAVFCWQTGAWLELLVDSLHVSELALFRRLLAAFTPGDVVLADRLYGNYAELSLLQARGVHAVCRVNRARKVDLRRGRRLGRRDRLMLWRRPDAWNVARLAEVHEPLPETLAVRVVRFTVPCRRAFRSRRVELATTLLDPQAYPAEALTELYRGRWLAELDLRSLKTTLGMDVLRCKSVAMVRKELALHYLAYNVIRALMRQAARVHRVDPQRLSFAGTRQRLLAWLPHWPGASPRRPFAHRQRLFVRRLLAHIAADPLPARPPRHEPRAIKRRRKSFPYLVHPRWRARNTAHYDKRQR